MQNKARILLALLYSRLITENVMPRDYKNSKSQERRDPIPGWAWMSGGLVIGLFVAGLVYLNEHTPKKSQELLTNAVKRGIQETRKAQDEKKPGEPEQKRPRFDFYTILPELEVAIPEQDLVAPKKQTSDKSSANTSQTSVTQGNGAFTLQVGSFRKLEEADRLKAKLALQGVVADIQTVTINDGDTWHRVRIGPIHDIDKVNQTRKRLRDLGVAAIVVKNKT